MVPTQQKKKENKMSSEVLVVDFWANGFGMRVRIALEEKGIEYKYMEEDLRIPERSSLVQEMNPVYKSVPVLIHGGRPICDSLVILQYIDHAWKVGPTLLPQHPHQRAHINGPMLDFGRISSTTRLIRGMQSLSLSLNDLTRPGDVGNDFLIFL